MALWSILCEIVKRPSIWEVVSELSMLMAPLWVAVIVGVVVGWLWKPKWAAEALNSSFLRSSSSQLVVEEASSLFPMLKGVSLRVPSLDSFNFQLPSCFSWHARDGTHEDCSYASASDCSLLESEKGKLKLVRDTDLKYLYKLVEEKDGGPAWIQMMDRSTPTMGYQAWRRDPETGPPQYRSRTVFEDATPEMVRDFFWDDEFRMKWDDMLVSAETLEECPTTGTMMVQWVRKFPFFCSDREYIIGRRIWESGRFYYCVTKGVPCSSVPRRQKPRRVDLYYSSWCIRAVESMRGDGRLTACEVLLFHYEDMGIPWEIAKLGVRQGMWGAVKKIEPGLRAYQKERASRNPISRCAFMAQINTKVSVNYLESLESNVNDSAEVETQDLAEKPTGNNIRRLLVVGGAVALACTLDRGLLTKAIIFGIARRFVKVGRGM